MFHKTLKSMLSMAAMAALTTAPLAVANCPPSCPPVDAKAAGRHEAIAAAVGGLSDCAPGDGKAWDGPEALAVADCPPQCAPVDAKVSGRHVVMAAAVGGPPDPAPVDGKAPGGLKRGELVTFVPEGYQFLSGDQFRIFFEANQEGYAYVFNRGTTTPRRSTAPIS